MHSVDALGKLGAPMLIDDTGTYDIHAPALYKGQGWPPLVRTILSSTTASSTTMNGTGMDAAGTANYEFETLPTNVQKEVMVQMTSNFQPYYEKRAKALLQKVKEGHRNTTSKVKYGFKAPVSMLLLPVFQKLYGNNGGGGGGGGIKFLHVVRDGRDVTH